MKWQARAVGLELDYGDYNSASIRDYIQKNPNSIFELKPLLPESNLVRRYYNGGLIPMFCFVSGMDWKDSKVKDAAHELVKQEFNPGYFEWKGKKVKLGRSTKGRENLNALVERLSAYLLENGATPESLDPEKFKEWRDTIYPYGGPENWIDYCLETFLLDVRQLQ